MAIEMTPVSSSNVSGFGYDSSNKTLAVQFSSGSTYHYSNVPEEVYVAFREADSKGSFFAREVRAKFVGELQKAEAE